MVALWCGWHPPSPALLSFSLIAVHMTRECDRTNVSESKEYVLPLTGTERWHEDHNYTNYQGKIQTPIPSGFCYTSTETQ